MYSVLGSLVDVVSVRDVVSVHGVLGEVDVVSVVGDLAFGVVSAVSVLGVSAADVVIALGEVSVVSIVGDSQCTQC